MDDTDFLANVERVWFDRPWPPLVGSTQLLSEVGEHACVIYHRTPLCSIHDVRFPENNGVARCRAFEARVELSAIAETTLTARSAFEKSFTQARVPVGLFRIVRTKPVD